MEFWLAIGFFFICLILESITSWIFIRGSKKHYPKLWKHAGKPTLLGNGDLMRAWPLNEYLMKKKYQKLKDPLALAFANRIRFPFVLSYFGAAFSVIIVVVVALIFGIPE